MLVGDAENGSRGQKRSSIETSHEACVGEGLSSDSEMSRQGYADLETSSECYCLSSYQCLTNDHVADAMGVLYPLCFDQPRAPYDRREVNNTVAEEVKTQKC